MEKRLLLALVLSIGVVLIFSQFNQPPPEKSEQQRAGADTETVKQRAPETTEQAREPSPEQRSNNQDTKPSPTQDEADVVSTEAETIPFETKKLKGSFSRRGATFRSVKLREYDQLDQPDKLVDLVAEHGNGFTFDHQYPDQNAAQSIYKMVESEDTNTFKFRLNTNDLSITKTYKFQPDSYQGKLLLSLENQSDESRRLDELDFPAGQQGIGSFGLKWGPGFGVNRSSKSRLDQIYVYYGKNGEMDYVSPGGGGMMSWLTGGEDEEDPYQFKRGPIEWTSVSSRYFAATIIPENRFDMLFVNAEAGADTFTFWSGQSSLTLGSGESRVFEYNLYLGPKEYDVLQDVYPGLETTLNYGWFTFLARPLLWGLNWIYAVIPNYGIAIIILSILIKIALYPLTKKGLTSMQKMKELQPELQELQDKYSDDKEKLNQKMMEFYQEHDLNPLGGCLPMLLQLPIFIGLYRMLEYSIELRGAPFMLWVTDLSSKDPYYILPVVMGIVMFFQQKYTMTASAMGGSAGQQQKIMMYFMPVMFVFLFMNFPVGLVLYWMTNSLMTLVQYALINRSLENST